MRRPQGISVYVASREVPRRFLGTRIAPKCEAELRELVGSRYVARARVTRPSKAEAVQAARDLARRRGWHVIAQRLSWNAREAEIDSMIAEEAAHPADPVGPVEVGPDAARLEAAAEVLQAVFLHEKHFDLESTIVQRHGRPVVDQDEEGHLWVTVRLHVPALDVDMWLDGTHPDKEDA